MKLFKLTQFILFLLILGSCNNNSTDSSNGIEQEGYSLNSVQNSSMNGTVKKKLSGMSIDVPEELVEADEEKIKKKYPGANRPDVVYCNGDMSVNIGYSITKKTLKISDLSEYLTRTSTAISSNYGSENVSQINMDTINEQPFAVIEFYSPTPDGKIYNLMLTTSVNDRMAIFTFNCLEKQVDEWAPELPEIFSTIRFD
ncbi:MAG: hypothetical protein ACT4ON_02910 [Bacteroidota bacterium]